MEPGYNFSSYHNGGPGREKDFERLAQTIGTNIQKISQNVLSMQKMVMQLGTHQDSQELRQQLHQIQHYTQQLAKDTSSNLKDLSNIPAPPSASDQRQWKMQKERLAEEFTSTLNTFQATQRRAAQKEKEEVQRARANSGYDPFGGVAGMLDHSKKAADRKFANGSREDGPRQEQLIELQDQHERQQMQMQDAVQLQMLEEQEQAIRQLESDINDVNQIFKELGSIVHEQGEVIDSIEASVEKTESFVSEGVGQLRSASNYQTKARKKKLILFILLLVVLGIIIGIIAWQAS